MSARTTKKRVPFVRFMWATIRKDNTFAVLWEGRDADERVAHVHIIEVPTKRRVRK